MWILTSSSPRHICSAPSIWMRIWTTADDRPATCAVYSRRLHSHSWLCSVHCATCCVAGEKSAGQGRSFLRVPGTYSPAKMNSDGNDKQRCADCASEAEHWHKSAPKKARNEPGSDNSTISVTTGAFRGYHFFKNMITLLQCLWFFRKHKWDGVPQSDVVYYYEAVIRPVMEYASPVWHSSHEALFTLEAIQRQACQIILGGGTLHTAVTVLLLSQTAFNCKPNNCSIRSSTSRNNAYISCYTLQENSLSLIISDLPTNCRAYLQRQTDSKTPLSVIL